MLPEPGGPGQLRDLANYSVVVFVGAFCVLSAVDLLTPEFDGKFLIKRWAFITALVVYPGFMVWILWHAVRIGRKVRGCGGNVCYRCGHETAAIAGTRCLECGHVQREREVRYIFKHYSIKR